VQQPNGQHARRMPPQNIGPAIAVEVPDAHDRRVGAYNPQDAAADARRATAQPDGPRAGSVPPEDIGPPVAVEVAAEDVRGAGSHGQERRAVQSGGGPEDAPS